MPNPEFRRLRITERVARLAGLLWFALFASQLVIAIHDSLVVSTVKVNLTDLGASTRLSIWLLLGLLAVNSYLLLLRSVWRNYRVPHFDWLLKYNLRVLLAWAGTQIVISLLFLGGNSFSLWLLDNLSSAYTLGSAGALAGMPLLLTRRWQRPAPEFAFVFGPQRLARERSRVDIQFEPIPPVREHPTVEIPLPGSAQSAQPN